MEQLWVFSNIFSEENSKLKQSELREQPTELELYFQKFRKHIVGIDQKFQSPFGALKIIYNDWTASGRMYRPIEEKMIEDFGPFVANTHT